MPQNLGNNKGKFMSDNPIMTKVNDHLGVTNIIEHDVMTRDLSITFQRIFDLLSKHFGPYGKYAMLVDPYNPLIEPVHTKDGINILRYVEMVSPMEKVIKNAIAHIGAGIEKAAGDGTTSSMMLVCAALKHLLNTLGSAHMSHEQLRTAFGELVAHIKNYFKDTSITLEKMVELYDGNKTKAVHDIAYWQSYSSSHGDEELSQAVAKLFASVPDEVWKYLIYRHDDYESDKRFEVIEGRGQFEFDAKILNPCAYNQDLQSWFKSTEDTRVILIDGVLLADAPRHEEFWNKLDNLSESGEKYAVIMEARIDSLAHSRLNNLMLKYPEQLAVFLHNVPDESDQTFRSILACLNKLDQMKDTPTEIPNATIEFQNNVLYLANVFTINDKGVNPAAFDLKHNAYSFISWAVNKIKYFENCPGNQQAAVKASVAKLRKSINSVLIGKQPVLFIGGLAYDNVAAEDVVNDCLLAVRTSLMEGFVPGGNKWLYAAVANYMQSPADPEDVGLENKITVDLARVFQNALKDIFVVAIGTLPLKYSGMIVRDYACSSFDFLNPSQTFDISHLTDSIKKFKDKNANSALIIQPMNVDIEVLERFGEVALKYVMTDRIITKDAAYVSDKE